MSAFIEEGVSLHLPFHYFLVLECKKDGLTALLQNFYLESYLNEQVKLAAFYLCNYLSFAVRCQNLLGNDETSHNLSLHGLELLKKCISSSSFFFFLVPFAHNVLDKAHHKVHSSTRMGRKCKSTICRGGGEPEIFDE